MRFRHILGVFLAAMAFHAPAQTHAAPGTNATFSVHGYVLEGNTVLPTNLVQGVLTNYEGDHLDVDRLKRGLGELQLIYRRMGYPTVSVTLPQQKLTNDVVHIRIIEGRLARILVTGNRFYSSNNVMHALPGLAPAVLLNTRWFQPELNDANANADRQIYPVISPGSAPGQTDLELKVKDRFPLHGRFEVNDKATPDTPILRIDSALQYNNLWQLNHQVGIEYNFTPGSSKSIGINGDSMGFLDAPRVDSGSAFYRLPLAQPSSLRELSEHLPVDFGYDQVTHQFHMPPTTGRPEMTFYASRSAVDIPPRYGPIGVITNTALLDIDQQSVEQDVTATFDGGAKLSYPLPKVAGLDSAVTVGPDFKSYEARNYYTNLTYANIYGTNQYGNRVLTGSQIIPLSANSGSGVQYAPISLQWAGSRPDPGGSWVANVEEDTFLSPLESGRNHFQEIAGSKDAGGTFAKVSMGIAREQHLPKGWSLSLHADGQWASEALINNEQFALGGSSGVRGYREGEVYGDGGWRTMFDVHAPAIRVGQFPTGAKPIQAYARCSWFTDYGQAMELRATSSSAVTQWGTGFGVFWTAGEHLYARLTLAWALRETPLTKAGDAFGYFKVGYQF